MKDLLESIKDITEKHDKERKENGENFNLFDVLNMRTDEVKTHSGFIAELLRVDGAHNQGVTFLKLFIQMLNEKEWKKHEDETKIEKLEAVKVEVEKYIGEISKNQDEGGRLDIVLSNDNFTICIENKIYAPNQPYQLERYNNYLYGIRSRDKNNTTILIYLTLTGSEYELVTNEDKTETQIDSNVDEGKKEKIELKEGEDYFCLSYKKDILCWLEACKNHIKEKNQTFFKETLNQYIILIKSLTNQLPHEMETEVQKEILKNIKAAETVKYQFDNAIKDIGEKVKVELLEKLKSCKVKDKFNFEETFNQNEGKYSSLFLKLNDESPDYIGIESFNGKGHMEGSIFIGRLDFKNEHKDINYKFGVWHSDVNIIYSKEELFNKYQEYYNGDEKVKEVIIDDLVQKIENFNETK